MGTCADYVCIGTYQSLTISPRETQMEEVTEKDNFPLSVREVNNLVRFLYKDGWISHHDHSDVLDMNRRMIRWLEARGIPVDYKMKEM
jgi:hypothetical protein